MTTPTLMPSPRQQFTDNNGKPLIKGMLFTYAAGTSTPLAAFQDPAGTIRHANPIRLDSRGEATVYFLGNYKIDLHYASGAQVPGYPVDNFNTDPLGLAGQTDALAADLLGNAGSTKVSFLQSGAHSQKRSLQDKGRDSVSVKDKGAKGDGVTNDSAAVNYCLAEHDSVRFTPGVYLLNEDLVLKTNQRMIVEAGAKLVCAGSRITSYLQDNITIRVDGEISSVGMRTGAARIGWPADIDPGNSLNVTNQRGFIEFGGVSGALATSFKVFGRGKIHGDWTGTPSLAGLWTGNLNFKGIAAWFCNDVRISDVEVYGFLGEAVYYYNNSAASTRNVLFDSINSHDNNFNGLNFNCGGTLTNGVIRNCTVDGALQGVELSVGRVTGCRIRNCETFPIQMGGGIVLDVQVDNNHIYGKANQGFNLVNAAGNPASPTGVVSIHDNHLFNAPQHAVYATALASVKVLRNVINGYAQKIVPDTQGFGIEITSNVGTAFTEGNVVTSPEIGFGSMIRNKAAVRVNGNNYTQDISNNRVIKVMQLSDQTATADEHQYYVFNGMGVSTLRYTTHYANGLPENIVGSDEFVRTHAEATAASGGTLGRYVVATFKTSPGATPDDSLVVDSNGDVFPAVHNDRDLGTNSNMWANLYCVAGVINRSDARLKTAVTPLSANELAAAKALSSEIGTYQWLDSIAEKGPTLARHHVGMTVQRCIEIMQAHGLSAFSYGFICYDEWPADDHREAGSAFGFRTDQMAFFIQRGLDARLAALEALPH